MKFDSLNFDKVPAEKRERAEEKIKGHFDGKGNPRVFRELPGGIVMLMSDKEFIEEMEKQDREVKDGWPRQINTPKELQGKRDLSNFIQSRKNSDEDPLQRSLIR